MSEANIGFPQTFPAGLAKLLVKPYDKIDTFSPTHNPFMGTLAVQIRKTFSHIFIF